MNQPALIDIRENWNIFFLAILICAASFNCHGAEAPRLLPFQGRLTDQNGSVVSDGVRLIQFKIYDAPVGGQVVWNGEVQKLTVNAGLVNTMLGSKASLAGVDFNLNLYLELTLDANNDSQITLADPPLLPRQSILPAVFAKEAADARLLDGHDWSSVFAEGATNPATARIAGNRIVAQSLTAAQIAPQTITAGQIADSTVTASKLAPSSLPLSVLAKEILDQLVPPGSITAFGGTNLPDGWRFCDGSPLSATNYPRLFVAIGTAWGAGYTNGAKLGDFNLPDFRGVFLRGISGVSTNDPDRNTRMAMNIGAPAGNSIGSIQPSQTGNHTHGGNTSTENGTLTAQVWVNSGGAVFYRGRAIPLWVSNSLPRAASAGASNNQNPADAGAYVVGETSSNNAHTSESRPLNAYVNYIIKC